MRLPIMLIFLSALLGCSENTNFPLPNRIDAATFSLETPAGWVLIEQQGFDTYVGMIADRNNTIYFDQGYFAFRRLENIKDTDGTFYFVRTTIDGVPAIIHKTLQNAGAAKQIRVSVYLDAGDNSRLNHLYVLDPTSFVHEAFLLEIMQTHKFK